MKVQVATRDAYVRITGKRFCQNCQRERPAAGFKVMTRRRTQLHVCEQCQKHKGKR